VWLGWQFALRPGLAAVTRALNRTGFARDEIAVANVDGVGVVGLQGDAAAVRNPVALRKSWETMQRPGLAFVAAAPQAIGRGHQQFAGLASRDRQTMDVEIQFLVSHLAVGPGFAIVVTAIYAVDLYTHPNGLAAARVDQNVGNVRRSGQATLGDGNGHFLPGLAAIGGAENSGRLGADEQDLGLGGMIRDRPDLFARRGRFNQIPVGAIVFAAVETDFAARKKLVRAMR